MNQDFQLLPEEASTMAGRVDALYFFLSSMTVVITLVIAGLVVFFAVRYRRANPVNRVMKSPGHWVEVSWIVFPLPILLFIFYWGASLYFAMYRPPQGAMEVTVVGKQWMWKLQHPQGRREINELHIPTGRPVRVSMISQDVIHSLYVPAFRIKQDVLPGRYTSIWFEATKPGEYHLFCAEYCGTNHSLMRGRVVVMTPRDYEQWLADAPPEDPPQVSGERLFEQFRCNTCHLPPDRQGRGPPLTGLYGSLVPLEDGSAVMADENHIRQSILEPQARVRAGYRPIMPTFKGQIREEELFHLVAYVKSLQQRQEAQQ